MQRVRTMQRFAEQIFKHGFGMLCAGAGFFGQSLRILFAVVLVEHRLHLAVVLVLKRFAQRQDDLHGAASVCGRQLCTVQAAI